MEFEREAREYLFSHFPYSEVSLVSLTQPHPCDSILSLACNDTTRTLRILNSRFALAHTGASTWSWNANEETVTIDGNTGAYLGLAKVYNGGELTDMTQSVRGVYQSSVEPLFHPSLTHVTHST